MSITELKRKGRQGGRRFEGRRSGFVLTNMGRIAELAVKQLRGRAGVAMPVALFGVVTVSVLAGGILVLSTGNMPLARSREEQARAMMLAEAAASHGIAVLRGSLRATPYNTLLRDSLFVGYGLPAASQIPATGVPFAGGRYYAKMIDDPGATEDLNRFNDVNDRLVLRCTGVSHTGATAVINAIVGPQLIPAFLANGNVGASGASASILGDCGSIHANGNLSSPGGRGFTVEKTYSATGIAGGTPQNLSGSPAVAESNADTISVPKYSYSNFCPASGNYVLRSDGYVVIKATGLALPATLLPVAGWRALFSGGMVWWTTSGAILPGTYCVQGNANISTVAAVAASIIAQGSISVSGSPVFTTPANPDGLLFFAGGDIYMRGNASSLFTGTFYARNQCDLAGSGNLYGNVMCLGETTVPPAANLAGSSGIAGNITITYDCNSKFGRERRILGWYQEID